MEAILFSADPNKVDVEAAKRHLAHHKELYWAVLFPIARVGPLDGFIHMCGGRVEYRITISQILPFSPNDQVDERFKPEAWIQKWKENPKNLQARPWKNQLVMTDITCFSCDTLSFKKTDGTNVRMPPQGYVRVLSPSCAPAKR